MIVNHLVFADQPINQAIRGRVFQLLTATVQAAYPAPGLDLGIKLELITGAQTLTFDEIQEGFHVITETPFETVRLTTSAYTRLRYAVSDQLTHWTRAGDKAAVYKQHGKLTVDVDGEIAATRNHRRIGLTLHNQGPANVSIGVPWADRSIVLAPGATWTVNQIQGAQLEWAAYTDAATAVLSRTEVFA